MAIWNGLTDQGAVVPIQVDAEGRVVVSGGGGLPSQVYGTAKAVGTFNSDGSTVFSYRCSAAHDGTGKYALAFTDDLPNTEYSVLVTAAGNAPIMGSAFDRSKSGCRVYLWNPLEAFTDAPFQVAVFNAEPTDVTPLILPNSALQDIERIKVAVGLDG
jgi:hypothetical protein